MTETITSRPVSLRIGSSRVTLAVSARIEPAPPPAPVIPWPTAPPPQQSSGEPDRQEGARR